MDLNLEVLVLPAADEHRAKKLCKSPQISRRLPGRE
jgi:hypothetical protein